jgi:hypothetical protein
MKKLAKHVARTEGIMIYIQHFILLMAALEDAIKKVISNTTNPSSLNCLRIPVTCARLFPVLHTCTESNTFQLSFKIRMSVLYTNF